MYDVLVIGGGPAGLSAALVLGRARRRVLVFDSGQPRNAPSPAAHSVFTRDGTPPLELLRIGREQLRPYESVEIRDAEVIDAVKEADGSFSAVLADGSRVAGRRILLATGMMDKLPEIDGLHELWGTGVLHCPFCHGWEVRDQPLALYARGETILDFAASLRGWSHDLAVCSNGPAGLSVEERQKLDRFGIGLWEEIIVRLEGETNGALERIVFANGSALRRRALFVRLPQRQHSPLAERLGCDLTDRHQVVINAAGRTSVPGVYAAGDLSRPLQQVVLAAADGTVAAITLTHELLKEEFA
ncbi:MAG TPA: NAD(P)/FAD-dependent oxidoreductase [Thermoanaerobaculia bacterium]|nr:NAD(P)/FAD-dependent oxidoreductase [Thermoanaerobaculia bacterium]